MPIDPNIPQCHHIKVTGLRCGSPSLRGRRYCYFHYSVTRALIRTDIPVLEDINSVQYGLNRLAEYILEKRIDNKQASLLLWLMQIASSNVRHARLEPFLKEEIVHEHPEDSWFLNSAQNPAENNAENPRRPAENNAEDDAEGDPELAAQLPPAADAGQPASEWEAISQAAGLSEAAADQPRAPQAPAKPKPLSVSSVSSVVNPWPSDVLRKRPTRQELEEIAARAIEKFRNTQPIQQAAPGGKRRRRPQS